jgi:hypothetical protein
MNRLPFLIQSPDPLPWIQAVKPGLFIFEKISNRRLFLFTNLQPSFFFRLTLRELNWNRGWFCHHMRYMNLIQNRLLLWEEARWRIHVWKESASHYLILWFLYFDYMVGLDFWYEYLCLWIVLTIIIKLTFFIIICDYTNNQRETSDEPIEPIAVA